MRNFTEKYLYPILVLATVGFAGYVVRFELLASEVVQVQVKVRNIEEAQELVAWLLCEDAIRKGEDEAIKRCKKVLKDSKPKE
jgi:hypothetical protein